MKEGEKFGRLTIIQRGRRDSKRRYYYLCRCSCGMEKEIRGDGIKDGKISSCGCLHKEIITKHGHWCNNKASRTYRSWFSMKQRCLNPNEIGYHRYGGRGIQICKDWYNFENFLKDMGERPSGKTLDRINCNGNYEKSNCRWATPQEQANNRRNNYA